MHQTEITRRTNKRVMIASFILILMAISGYVMELVRGTRDLSYVLLMSLSLLAPIGFSFIFYSKPKYNEAFKGIALYSFIFSWMIMLSFSPKVIQEMITTYQNGSSAKSIINNPVFSIDLTAVNF